MKYIILPIYFILFIALLSSCSRYSHIPKVRAKAKTTTAEKVKAKKQQSQQTLTIKIADVAPIVSEEVKSTHIQTTSFCMAEKETTVPKEIQISPTHKNKKKTYHKHTRKQASKAQNKQAKKDFWDTFLGETLEELLMGLVLLFILILGLWLIEIGLGWLVTLILIALAIWLIIEIVSAAGDVLDFLSDFLFWAQ